MTQIRPRRVAHVVINVTDLERSRRFYCDGLGMSVTGSFEGQMLFLYFGEPDRAPHPFYHDLGLYKVDRAAPEDFRKASGVSHIALLMTSAEAVDAATDRLRQQGFKVLKGPATHKEDGYRYTYVEDPDRNVLELVAPTELTVQLSTSSA
jgi:catechol 2,3-dioxygenase-like lactoylglutathione lyase family enzyme